MASASAVAAAAAALPPAAQALQAAILAMYGCREDGAAAAAGAGHDAQRQREAIAWLLRFADAPEAWDAFPRLLAASPHAAVRFYAANSVYTLVCRGWTRLPPERQAAVASFLWASLGGQAPALEPSAMRRLCLALAASAALSRTPGAVTQYVARAVSGLGGGGGGGGAQGHAADAAAQHACLELLRCLPEEAADKPLSSSRAERVRLEMAAASESVLDALQCALAEPASPFHVGAAAAAASPSAGAAASPALPIEGCAAALRALKQWLELGGVTLGSLGARYPRLLRALLGGLLSVAHPAVASAAAAALECAFNVRVHPRERGRDDALTLVAGALVAAAAQLAQLAREARWDLLRPIAATLGALGLHEDEWMAVRAAGAPPPPSLWASDPRHVQACFPFALASADAPALPPTVGGAPVGLGVLLGDLILQLAACADRSVATLTASCLMGVQSMPMAERHPFFRRPVFGHLLTVTLEQSCYRLPRGADAPDEFLAFRGPAGEAADALADCRTALGAGAFVRVCVQWLARQQQQQQQPSPPADGAAAGGGGLPGRTASWFALEAVLHCVGTAARETDGMLACLEPLPVGGWSGGRQQPPAPSSSAHAAADATALASLLALAISGPVLAHPAGFPEVASSACRLITELACCVEPHLGDALAAGSGGRPLRLDTAPPFASLSGGTALSAPPSSEPGGGAQLSVHSAALVEGMLRLAVACLQLRDAVPLLRSAPAPDDMAGLVAAAGSTLRLPAPPGSSGGGASDDELDGDVDDDDNGNGAGGGGQTGGHREGANVAAGEASLGWRAAGALCALAGPRACRPLLLGSPRLLALLLEGVEAGVSRGLPLAPALKATEAVLRVLAGLPEEGGQRGGALRAAFAPLVARLGASAAAAAAAASSARVPAGPASALQEELSLCHEAVLAMALVRSAAASELLEPPPQSSSARLPHLGTAAGSAAHAPLDFVGDALWRACEVALPALVARADVAGVLLQGLRAVVRSCPRVLGSPGRVGSLLSLCVQLYQAHLYPDALSVVGATLDSLPELVGAARYTPDGRPVASHALGLPRDVVGSCSQLMAAVAAATLRAAGLSAEPPGASVTLAEEPLALPEYFRLCQSLLDTVPLAMLGVDGDTAAAAGGGGSSGSSMLCTLQLMSAACAAAASKTDHGASLRCASHVLGALLDRDELLALPGWAASVAAAVSATIVRLVRSLLACLFDDAASSLAAASSAVEMLRLLFVRFAAHGVVGIAHDALDEAAAAAAAAADATSGSAASTSDPGGADLETGLPCLSEAERRALLAGAAALAATSPRRFKLVLTDLGKVGRRQLAKDALLSHVL